MAATSTSIPSWLSRALSNDSQFISETVCPALSKREYARDHMRTRSLTESPSTSLLARGQQALTSALGKIDPVAHYSITIAHHPDNIVANRYSNIQPYDRTRVVVGDLKGSHCSIGAEGSKGRYFNASWVRELYGGKSWIATQAPLPRTAHVFLSAIVQPISTLPASLKSSHMHSFSRVRTIVQLTQNVERGRQKAHAYFPATPGQSMLSNPDETSDAPVLKVTLLESKRINEACCVQSKVSVVPVTSTNPQDAVVFTHLLYAAWPDHGVPEDEDRASLLAFVHLVDRVNKDTSSLPSSADPDPPIMVNCSAGIGRTGSFIAMSSLLRAYHLLSDSLPLNTLAPPPQPLYSSPVPPLGPLPKELQEDLIAQEIDNLREQRPGMVQRDEQIHLIYDILNQAFGVRGTA
ncbi:protein-tyrosine phosphatase-like protein [Suillus clintonianus]|uniref:protein-tyrosine phosphatase-like protein n=1 Tax=Suillus clintonianus TaxID=1904413 RepID=UPI001B8797E3|nr:protein-tyrosine phosphatase-like protein [Suillus clintonianus]KAG2155732.1 protein-tyrosine phosphatase-like protein [Suillus clintonianus]